MKIKLLIGLLVVVIPVVYLFSIQDEITESGIDVSTAIETTNKPDIGFLPADEMPATFNALSSGTAYGIAVPGRMVTPQATYKMLNPELQDSLTAMIDTTPKFRKGGFRYEELSDDEKNKLQDRSLKPGGNENKSLVSSISAGGQLTNSANNGGFIFIPADPHGAAGPNQVVNVFNTSIEFYDKDGSNGSSRSLESFFAPVSPLNFTFDPKVLYDQYEDRFVVVTLERQDTAGGDPDNTSRVLVAVSATSDPNGAWFMTAFNSEVFINGADRWFDYPGFAVDEEVIYLTGNMFGYGNAGTFGGVRMWMIDKTTFYAGGGATVIGPLDPFAGGGFEVTSQPAHTYGNPPAGMGTYLMGYSRLSDGTNEFWQFVRVDNPTGAVSFTQGFIFVGDIEPPTAGALPSAPQSGTGLTVQTNDPRALDAVWRDGQLFTSATIESGSQVGETSASWYVFDANGGGVVTNDFGIIDGEDIAAGTFTFFPSIAVNADGGIGVGFSASSPSIFPGSYFAMRSPADAAGTMRGSQVIRPGTDFYHRTFGGTNRWGDYSAVAVDPNDECFWVYNKHAVTRSSGATSENGLYETAFGEFCNIPPAVGVETIAVNDGQTVTTLVGGATSVLDNDSDADADDTISAVLTSGPTEASAFNLNANGTFSYTHDGGNNASDAFTYNACDDGSPQECTSSQVSISITLSDSPPTAVADSYTVNEDSGTTSLDVTDNDTDPDGGPLNITAVGSASNGTAAQNGNNINYTPNDDYCGSDAFTYTLNGGSGATVNMTVDCVNDDPVAVNDAASTNEDELVAVSVLNGDSDVDAGDTLSVTSCSNASNGSVNRNGNNCEFTPAQDFNGQGTFD
ncbi:Ig-like domain-containing protein, partial [Marinicella sp. S1101]